MRAPFVSSAGVLIAAVGIATAQAPSPPAPAFNIEVRNAAVGDLLQQLGRNAGVSLRADAAIFDQRVTLAARNVTVADVQAALASLFHATWREDGTLVSDPEWLGQVEAYRRRRDTQLVAAIHRIRTDIERGQPSRYAAALAAEVRARHPDLTGELAHLSLDYLRHATLVLALDRSVVPTLVRTGSVAIPFSRLPLGLRPVVTRFVMANLPPQDVAWILDGGLYPASAGVAPPRVLEPRLEYHLLYGDAVSGPLLLVRAGLPDSWATVIFPSTLAALPSSRELFPPAPVELNDPALLRRIARPLDLTALDWDQGLLALAQATGLKIIADAYLRPPLFATDPRTFEAQGLTVKEALDHFARRHRAFWWKQGDWVCFRREFWLDETRVAVPERRLRQLGETLATQTRLADEQLDWLAGLRDEQLLTLHLAGSAAGGGQAAPLAAFDLNEIELLRQALRFWQTLLPEQREVAVQSGLPAALMQPLQLQGYLRIGLERGYPPDPTAPGGANFRVYHSFRRSTDDRHFVGALLFEMGFAPGVSRTARLALALPAPRSPRPPMQSGS